MITAIITWAAAGALIFATVTLATGGRVRPTRAALLALAAGPGVWGFLLIWLAFDHLGANTGARKAIQTGIAEAQRDAALAMLEAILDDHREHTGDTCLADGMEREIDALLQATGRRPRIPATK